MRSDVPGLTRRSCPQEVKKSFNGELASAGSVISVPSSLTVTILRSVGVRPSGPLPLKAEMTNEYFRSVGFMPALSGAVLSKVS